MTPCTRASGFTTDLPTGCLRPCCPAPKPVYGQDAGGYRSALGGELLAAVRAHDDPLLGRRVAVRVQALRATIDPGAPVGLATALGNVALLQPLALGGVQQGLELAIVESLVAR